MKVERFHDSLWSESIDGGEHALEGGSVKKYEVRLSAEERDELEALIRKGKSAARRLLKARLLLKADVSRAGSGWIDSKIIEALETNASMVYRVRKQLHCQSNSDYFSKTSKLDFTAVDNPGFLRVDLSGSMAAPSTRHFALTLPTAPHHRQHLPEVQAYLVAVAHRRIQANAPGREALEG